MFLNTSHGTSMEDINKQGTHSEIENSYLLTELDSSTNRGMSPNTSGLNTSGNYNSGNFSRRKSLRS